VKLNIKVTEEGIKIDGNGPQRKISKQSCKNRLTRFAFYASISYASHTQKKGGIMFNIFWRGRRIVNEKQLHASSFSSVCLSARNSPTTTGGIFVKFRSDLGYSPTQITGTQNADPRTLLTISSLLSSSLLRHVWCTKRGRRNSWRINSKNTERIRSWSIPRPFRDTNCIRLLSLLPRYAHNL
jgi:hypothetical protein